jgi:WD repeat-containing protein 1 (actin-interacting protein 1)
MCYAFCLCVGEGSTKRTSGLVTTGGVIAAVSWDDKLRIGDAITGEWKKVVPLPGQPKGVALSTADPSTCIVVTSAAIIVVTGGGEAVAAPVPAPYGPTCIDISSDGKRVFVGGSDKRVHVYSLDAGSLSPIGDTREAGAAISVISLSPDSKLLAVGDALKEVFLFNADTRDVIVSARWVFHTTRITGLSWAPSGRLLASVSTDRRLCLWDPVTQELKKEFPLAHAQPFVAVGWASDEALWTLGSDGIALRRDVSAF